MFFIGKTKRNLPLTMNTITFCHFYLIFEGCLYFNMFCFLVVVTNRKVYILVKSLIFKKMFNRKKEDNVREQKKPDNKRLAEFHINNAFRKVKVINISNGSEKPYRYKVVRVGLNDYSWVDSDGVLYRQEKGKFEPSYLIPGVFDNIPKASFDQDIYIATNNGTLKEIKAFQFGDRENMMVGEDGVLYSIRRINDENFIGDPRSSCHGINARLNSSIMDRALEVAKKGYDEGCIEIAKSYLANSDISHKGKKAFILNLERFLKKHYQSEL